MRLEKSCGILRTISGKLPEVLDGSSAAIRLLTRANSRAAEKTLVAPQPKSPRRVLICAAEFPPLGGGGVIRVAKLAKYLPTLGWQVTVACSDEPLAGAVDRSLLEEIPTSVRVLRLRPPLGRNVAQITAGAKARLDPQSHLFGFLFRARAAARAMAAIPDRWIAWASALSRTPALELSDPDIIVTSGPPHSVHIAGALLSRRLRVPFVMDLRDEWSARSLTRSRLPWRRAIDRWVERWCLCRAARLVVVSEASARRYARLYPWVAGRLAVIPNGYDPTDLPGPEQSTGGGRSDTLTVGYAGSFQVGTCLQPLFEALGRVLASEEAGAPKVRFVMLGAFRPEEIDLARRMLPEGALNIEPFLAHRHAVARVATWDVLLVIADDGESSLAGKIYEYLALRKPILVVAPDGPATRLVASADAGVWADPRDANGISDALRRALARVTDPEFRGAPDGMLAQYDRRVQAATWSALLEELVVQIESPPCSANHGRGLVRPRA